MSEDGSPLACLNFTATIGIRMSRWEQLFGAGEGSHLVPSKGIFGNAWIREGRFALTNCGGHLPCPSLSVLVPGCLRRENRSPGQEKQLVISRRREYFARTALQG